MVVPISPGNGFQVETVNGPYLDGTFPHHVSTATEEAHTYNPLGLFIFYQSKEELLKPGPDIDDFRHRPRKRDFRDLTPTPPDQPRAATGDERKATTLPRLA
ncbi:MAG: hypothetical protein ACXWH0_17055 [Acidimicrobiia bacterium]